MSLKNYLLFSLFLSFSTIANAQSDTTYYNEVGYRVADWESCDFFRITQQLPDKRFSVNDFYSNRKPKFSGVVTSLDSMIYDGYCIHYGNRRGHKVSEGRYSRDKKDGVWKVYYYNSDKVAAQFSYSNGLFYGEQITFYENGVIKSKSDYKYGNELSAEFYDEKGNKMPRPDENNKWSFGDMGKVDSSNIFHLVEQMPQFPGGGDKVNEFLVATIHYPEVAQEEGIMGKVTVRFIVDETGAITYPRIVKAVHPVLDAEALRVIKAMPRWQPGYQDGLPVKVYFNLPIVFRLE